MESVLQFTLNALMLGSMYSLMAVGFTLFFGVLDVVQFAHSEIFMVGIFSALASINILEYLGINNIFFLLIGAIVCSCICTTFINIIFGRVTIKPLKFSPSILTLVATLAGGVVLRYMVMLFFPHGTEAHFFPTLLPKGRINFGRIDIDISVLLIFSLSILLIVFLKKFLDKTKIGMQMRAVAQDKETASLMGVNVDAITDITFFIAGILGAIGGVLYGSYYNFVQYNIGEFYGPIGFAAAVIGGLGNIYGSILGGYLFAIIVTFTAAYLPGGVAFKFPIGFAALIIFLTIKPSGILGTDRGIKI